ncbi:MAG TPA: AbiV family abortive infection protein [Thermoanaerobaculia bacterium]|jgi:AbiV family abortive infection protein|nr:AbiV family abortive infection protein [Thermoanaerobaculia bacterium]
MIRDLVLTYDQILDGYQKSVANGLRLLHASMDLVAAYPDVALGLAELGQEEIGKSLSLLAAFSLPMRPEPWRQFWDTWRDHKLKGYRAFLYEIICPVRIVAIENGRSIADGVPTRSSLHLEKEAAFYVDFDEDSAAFVAPEQGVDPQEAYTRCFTLLYLAITADRTMTALTSADPEFRLRAFSRIAERICTDQDLLQEDMPYLLVTLSQESPRHASLVSDLEHRLNESHRGQA